jgi:beta-ureidopropionase
LIQATNAAPPDSSLEATKKAMVDKHVAYIRQAAAAGAQIVCLQEIFYGPYFCAEQTGALVRLHRAVPDGPTIQLMQDLARQHSHRPHRSGLRGASRKASTTTPPR